MNKDSKASINDLRTLIRVAKDSVDRFGKSIERLKMSCPDCKDGFYYPFTGPRETCRTCDGSISNTPAEVKSCLNFQLQGSYAALLPAQSQKYLEEQSATNARLAREYIKRKSSDGVAYGAVTQQPVDESGPLKEIGHHRQRAAEMISTHLASVHPDPQDAYKEHFLASIYGDKVLTAAKAQDVLNKLAMVSKSTDWSQWFPNKDYRSERLATIFEGCDTKLVRVHDEAIEEAIIGRMFKSMAFTRIKEFFKDRKTVYLSEIAAYLNCEPRKRSKYLYSQTLRENGFDPKEL